VGAFLFGCRVAGMADRTKLMANAAWQSLWQLMIAATKFRSAFN
jgi:hypothetical protein